MLKNIIVNLVSVCELVERRHCLFIRLLTLSIFTTYCNFRRFEFKFLTDDLTFNCKFCVSL